MRREWPIVIGGCHRSGTSLVRRVLDTHSRIHCGPEVPFLRDFHGDYREDQLRHLRYATAAKMLVPNEALALLGAGFVRLHERAAERAGKGRWADKAPENVLYTADWERLLDGPWLFVHVVRNPLDTVASMQEAGFPLTLPPDLRGRVAHYLRYAEAGFDYSVRYPARARTVTYEQIVAAPEYELARLMEWLGEELEPRQLLFNTVAHERGLEDPKIASTTRVHDESVGRWRTILTPGDAREVWDRTRALWRRMDPDGRLEDAFRPPSGRPPRLGVPAPRRVVPGTALATAGALGDPVVIGGSGGSGTRVVKQMLEAGGSYLGARLNASDDALHFVDFDRAWGPLFVAREATSAMGEAFEAALAAHLADLPADARGWGWKHPQSFLLLPFLSGRFSSLRFIHLVRDGRDMAFSPNQQQLALYGPTLLGSSVDEVPGHARALAFWALSNLRAADFGETELGPRYLRMRFEDLCRDPTGGARTLLSFARADTTPLAVQAAAAVVDAPATIGRWRKAPGQLVVAGQAREALERFGYEEDRPASAVDSSARATRPD